MVLPVPRFFLRWTVRRASIKGCLPITLSLLFTLALLRLLFSSKAEDGKFRKRFLEKSPYFQQPLITWQQELVRLQSFLKRRTIACKAARNVGGVPVCLEDRAGKKLLDDMNFTVIALGSGDFSFTRQIFKMSNGAHVMSITTSRSNFFVPNGQPSQKYTFEQQKDLEEDLKKLIQGFDQIDIMEIHDFKDEPIKPELLLKLAEEKLLQPVRQIHFFLTLNREPNLLFQWYSVLLKMKFNYDFDLYSAKQVNGCDLVSDENSTNCTYIISWLRQENEQLILPEVKPSNDEQAETVLSQIINKKYKCSSLTFPSTPLTFGKITNKNGRFLQPFKWPLCLRDLSPPCTIFSFRSNEDDVFAKFLSNFDCNFCSNNDLSIEKDILKCSKCSQLSLKNYTQSSIEVLHLNLHGGEWSVLQQMIDQKILMRVHQIIATVHVWFGEDYHELIRQQMLLQQMAGLGFEVYFSEPLQDLSNPDMSYKNSFTKQCCFVIGWLKNQMKIE